MSAIRALRGLYDRVNAFDDPERYEIDENLLTSGANPGLSGRITGEPMNTAEKINKMVQGLPESMLDEVLDFVEFLQSEID